MSGTSPFFLTFSCRNSHHIYYPGNGNSLYILHRLGKYINVLINSCKITDVGKYLKMFAKNVTFKCINLALQYMSLVSLFLSLKYPLMIN